MARVARDLAGSSSFLKLRRLAESFERLQRGGQPPSPDEDRALRRLAGDLGTTAVGLLVRQLMRPAAGEPAARWAHTLLADAARAPAVRARVVADLGEVVRRADSSDRAKLRAMTLLAELDADVPAETQLDDPDAARRGSLHELARCLGSPADIARAADHLIEELPFEHLVDLIDDLVEAEPGSALALCSELLVRDDLDEACRHELRQRQAHARQPGPSGAPSGSTSRRVGARAPRLGRHADGRTVLLVTGSQPGSRPRRLRLLCLLVGSEGALLDGHYAEDMTPGAIEREFAAPLASQGFTLELAGLDAARGLVIQAARMVVLAGRLLPRSFYLGRDLLGLRDEHLDGTPRCRAAGDTAALLDRAIELIAAGQPDQARPLCQRYVADAPDDAEGHAQLGLCLLGEGQAEQALFHLARAAWLAPGDPLHHWNLAAAAHRAGRPGGCYLALCDYRDAGDRGPDALRRTELAERFIHEYERLAALQHPGTAPAELAASEDRIPPGAPAPRRARRHRRHQR